ncbi:lipoprotein, putative [Geotalea daltonii FRC-32]|uniref:Lipoprotein, putative n=1 Tax=Geotalea daltonii (strain DSM 22248 / JCM 15807 / FRC-32) TaxID=316067 RepID=B9M8Q0_GEODF|nr:lipoprotein, putative [Geotalea daltonii FRC-32]
MKAISVLFLLVTLPGCGVLRTGAASLKSTADFMPMEADRRVFAEAGGEDVAAVAAQLLPEAVATVEKQQGRPFPKPVEVYVTRDEESFAAFTGVAKQVRGAVILKLFLSGGLRKEPERIRRILVHELSHMHLWQYVGLYPYNANLPSWFQEGLAVLVSGGGGAERVSEDAAAAAIAAGKAVTPESTGSFFFKKSGASYGLEPHMFYRQSGMFVSYLKSLDEERFAAFMSDLEGGRTFEDAFNDAFRGSVGELWQVFAARCKTAADLRHRIFRRTQSPQKASSPETPVRVTSAAFKWERYVTAK